MFLLTHKCQIKSHGGLHGNLKSLLGLAHCYYTAHAMLIPQIPQGWVYLGQDIQLKDNIITLSSICLYEINVGHVFMMTKKNMMMDIRLQHGLKMELENSLLY